MTDSFLYNSPRRLLELWKELSGEDLTKSEPKDKKEAAKK